MTTRQEFIKNLKEKYPAYRKLSDKDLYSRIIKKYPQYDFIEKQPNLLEKVTEKLFKTAVGEEAGIKSIGAPFAALRGGELLKDLSPEKKKIVEKMGLITRIGGAFTPFSPAVQAGVTLTEEQMKGKAIEDAGRQALMVAAVDATLMKGGQLATKAGGKLLQFGARVAKKVPKWAMVQAVKRPEILTRGINRAIDAADDIKRAAKGLKDQADDVYRAAIDKIQVTKKVPTLAVKNTIQKLNIDPQIMAAKIKREAKRQLVNVSDDSIDSFFNGKPISFDEAKRINSLLAATQRDLRKGATVELGGGVLGKIEAVKAANMKAMEGTAKGIKKINQQYAIDRTIAERATKHMSGSESKIKAIAKQAAGKEGTRTREIRELIKLEERVGKPLLEPLKDAAAKETFETASEGLLQSYLTPRTLIGVTAGAGLGGRGGEEGRGIRMGLGALAGGLAATVGPSMLSPAAVGKGIQLTPKIPQILRAGTSPLRQEIAKQVGGRIGNDR